MFFLFKRKKFDKDSMEDSIMRKRPRDISLGLIYFPTRDPCK